MDIEYGNISICNIFHIQCIKIECIQKRFRHIHATIQTSIFLNQRFRTIVYLRDKKG